MRIPLLLLLLLMPGALLPGCRRGTVAPEDSSQVPPPKPGTVRVVCWNLEWFPGRSPHPKPGKATEHVRDIAEALARLKPDVLLLQEVQDGPELKALVAGLDGFQQHTVSKFGGLQRLAIASRLPAESAWSEGWEKDGTDDPPRGFAYAGLRLPDGCLLMTYTVHLKSNAGARTGEDALKNRSKREEAAQQLLGHIAAERAKLPVEPAVLIAGDFNTDPDTGQFEGEHTIPILVRGGYRWLFEGVDRADRITWPADKGYPDAHFDHAFAAGLEIESITVPAEFATCSDHRPVVIDVVMEPVE